MIQSIYIQNFKIFESFRLDLNADLNILVGNNEAGKSTILEAIALVLTKRIGGRNIEGELSAFLFNKKCADQYLTDLRNGKNPPLPSIVIEAYLSETKELAFLKGSNNTKKSDEVGVRLEIAFNEDYKEEYASLLADASEKKLIPAEYYKINWYSFANNAITSRSLPINIFSIDATSIRLQSGTDYYIQNLVSENLTPKERVALAVAYRKLKESFSEEPSIQGINKNLSKGAITEKDVTITIDVSQKTNWETNLVPHLDDLPFQFAGKGEQTALKIMLALERKVQKADIVLIEEPENHLSYSSMSKLISKIATKCAGRQIVITTHSAYVLNKLGIEKVQLLHGNKTISLAQLPEDTPSYFKKLSGYDTLRLILADKAILVEGPSDELITQKAFLVRHGKLPLDAGVDVINVRGLSFARFLDLARELKNHVRVITDNDGDYQKRVREKYEEYGSTGTIKIFADADDSAKTLEPQLVKVNDLAMLNRVFNTNFPNTSALTEYMINNKTECALRIFESNEPVVMPQYIKDAID